MTRTYLGVGLVTLSTLLLELLLTRLFSVTLYYHFAFMVISLALFGLGLSGVVLYLRPGQYPAERLSPLLSQYSRRFAAATVLALLFVTNFTLTAPLDVLQPGLFSWQNVFQLAFLYAFATAPFYFGGMVVSLALFHLRRKVATLYFFDLAGASLACLLLDWALRALGGPNAVLLAGVLAAMAAVLFGGSKATWRLERRSIWLAGGLTALLLANIALGVVSMGSFKFVRQERLTFSRWNALSRVEVQEDGKKRPALTIDSNARTNIHSYAEREGFDAEQGVSSLVYTLKRQSKVLIIGPGGGVDVLSAMVAGNRDITLVEINPIIIRDVMLGKYRKYSGDLYARPGVRPIVAEGRSYIRRSQERFDVIQATLVDTWASTAAGAFALSENHLYTVEAVEDYLQHLRKGGIVTMARWVGARGLEFIRLGSLARAALERMGVEQPRRHVFAANDGLVGALLVKRVPFSKDELARLHRRCQERSWNIIHSPQQEQHNPLAIVLGSKDLAAFYRTFPVDVRPVYDDRPFFFYAVKPERALAALFSGEVVGLNSLAAVVLAALLGLVSLFVLAGIVVPLWLGRRRALHGAALSKWRDLAFFICIGAGFIAVEIALLQRFILHLGHPIHSLRVVLFSLLLAGGVGSLISSRVRRRRSLLLLQEAAAAGTAALMAAYGLGLGDLLQAAVSWSLAARVALSVALVVLPGLMMGMLLPTAIRLLSQRHAEIIPWAWGLNGAASVLGSVLAMVISIHLGFTITLYAGAALYLLAGLFGFRTFNKSTE